MGGQLLAPQFKAKWMRGSHSGRDTPSLKKERCYIQKNIKCLDNLNHRGSDESNGFMYKVPMLALFDLRTPFSMSFRLNTLPPRLYAVEAKNLYLESQISMRLHYTNKSYGT